MNGSRHVSRLNLAVFLLTAVLAALLGCGKSTSIAPRLLETDSGLLPWDTTGTVNVMAGTYLDRGEEKNTFFLDTQHSPRLNLASPRVAVEPGQALSFRFACRFLRGRGELLESRLKMFDESGALKADSILYYQYACSAYITSKGCLSLNYSEVRLCSCAQGVVAGENSTSGNGMTCLRDKDELSS